MKKIFYDHGKWFAFEAPDPQDYRWGFGTTGMAYHDAYDEAKANALEVGNSAILDGFEFDMQPYIKTDDIKIYSWPGSAVIKDGKYILQL